MSDNKFFTDKEILKKFDNHEIAISELGKNLTHTIKQVIKLENYITFLEKKIAKMEELPYNEDDKVIIQ